MYESEVKLQVAARAIVITSLRPRVAKDTDNNKIPNLDDGTDMVSCALPSG